MYLLFDNKVKNLTGESWVLSLVSIALIYCLYNAILCICYQLLKIMVMNCNDIYVCVCVCVYFRVGPLILGPTKSAIPWAYYY